MTDEESPEGSPGGVSVPNPPDELPADPNATLNLQQTQASKSNAGEAVTSRVPSLKTTIVAPDQTGPRLTLKGLLAEGGFGEVWMASQGSLRRTVAVKRTRQALAARFANNKDLLEDLEGELVQEALLLASLDHPNIAPIHDLVFEPDGTPKLAMKLVRGRPWKKVLDEERGKLAADEFLARHIPILVQVAQAVAFAHSRGIIHRDIKPSQVMIADFGQVYLMDWGLALVFDEDKALEAGVEAVWSLPTRKTASSPGGTVAFMAPEQTKSSAASLGPATDVFLLGGTLYYLLTGHGPYERERDAKSAFRRAVTGEISRASTKNPQAPEELVELCHHALERGLDRRLGSVLSFIERLQAYLSGSNRRKDAVALVGRAQAVLETAVTYREFSQALEWLERARTLWPETPGCGEAVERALGGYSRQALRQGDLKLARVQAERLPAGAYRNSLLADVAEHERSQLLHRRQRRVALVLCGLLGVVIITLGYSYTVRVKEERQRAEAARHQADGLIQYMLGDLYEQLEPLGQTKILKKAGDKSLEYFDGLPKEALTPNDRLRRAAVLHQVGRVREATGNSEGAIASFSEAVSSLETLLEIPATRREARKTQIDVLISLGNVLRRHGRGDEALAALERLKGLLVKARAEEPRNQELKVMAATASIGISRLLQGRGELEKARKEAEAALSLRSELRQANPNDPGAGRDLSIVHNELGRILRRQGRLDAAEAELEKALAVVAEIAAKEPENRTWKRGLGICNDDLAATQIQRGHLEEARRSVERFRELARELRARDPENTEWLANEALSYRSLGELELSAGNVEAARQAFAAFEDRERQLVRKDPANAIWSFSLTTSILYRAEVLLELHTLPDAAAAAREAHEILSGLAASDMELRARCLGWSALIQGETLVRAGRNAEADPLLSEAERCLSAADRTEFHAEILRLRRLLLSGRRNEAAELARRLLASGYREARFLRLLASELPDLTSSQPR